MPNIQKISSGKIFEDDFTSTSLNTIWQKSINDASVFDITTNSGYLKITNKYESIYLLIDMPNSDFVFESEIDYIPTLTDEGGIIIYKSYEKKIEAVSYKQSNLDSNIYTNIKIIKNGNIFTAYGKKSGISFWEMIGSQYVEDMNKIGFVFNSTNPNNTKSIKFNYAKIYRNQYLTLTNLTEGKSIKLLDSGDNIIQEVISEIGKDTVKLDLSNLSIPISCKIEVEDIASGIKDKTDLLSIWPGDIYYYGYLIEVYDDTNLLNNTDEIDLGNMISGKIIKILKVKNPSSLPITNIKIKASKMYENTGEEWVKFAIYNYINPTETYEEITIPLIQANDERPIWIEITKNINEPISNIGNYKFLLDISY